MKKKQNYNIKNYEFYFVFVVVIFAFSAITPLFVYQFSKVNPFKIFHYGRKILNSRKRIWNSYWSAENHEIVKIYCSTE